MGKHWTVGLAPLLLFGTLAVIEANFVWPREDEVRPLLNGDGALLLGKENGIRALQGAADADDAEDPMRDRFRRGKDSDDDDDYDDDDDDTETRRAKETDAPREKDSTETKGSAGRKKSRKQKNKRGPQRKRKIGEGKEGAKGERLGRKQLTGKAERGDGKRKQGKTVRKRPRQRLSDDSRKERSKKGKRKRMGKLKETDEAQAKKQEGSKRRNKESQIRKGKKKQRENRRTLKGKVNDKQNKEQEKETEKRKKGKGGTNKKNSSGKRVKGKNKTSRKNVKYNGKGTKKNNAIKHKNRKNSLKDKERKGNEENMKDSLKQRKRKGKKGNAKGKKKDQKRKETKRKMKERKRKNMNRNETKRKKLKSNKDEKETNKLKGNKDKSEKVRKNGKKLNGNEKRKGKKSMKGSNNRKERKRKGNESMKGNKSKKENKRKRTKGMKENKSKKEKKRKGTKSMIENESKKEKKRKGTKNMKESKSKKEKKRKGTKGKKEKKRKKGMKMNGNKSMTGNKSKKDKERKRTKSMKGNKSKKDKKKTNKEKKGKKNKDKTPEDITEPEKRKQEVKGKACSKLKGKCRKKKWTEKNDKNKKKCLNQYQNGGCSANNKAKYVCCLKSNKCKKKYLKKKCKKNGGKASLITDCTTNQKTSWCHGSQCTCCLPCLTSKACKKTKGVCQTKCKHGVWSGVQCGGAAGCLCCRKKKDAITETPTVTTPASTEKPTESTATGQPTTCFAPTGMTTVSVPTGQPTGSVTTGMPSGPTSTGNATGSVPTGQPTGSTSTGKSTSSVPTGIPTGSVPTGGDTTSTGGSTAASTELITTSTGGTTSSAEGTTTSTGGTTITGTGTSTTRTPSGPTMTGTGSSTTSTNSASTTAGTGSSTTTNTSGSTTKGTGTSTATTNSASTTAGIGTSTTISAGSTTTGNGTSATTTTSMSTTTGTGTSTTTNSASTTTGTGTSTKTTNSGSTMTGTGSSTTTTNSGSTMTGTGTSTTTTTSGSTTTGTGSSTTTTASMSTTTRTGSSITTTTTGSTTTGTGTSTTTTNSASTTTGPGSSITTSAGSTTTGTGTSTTTTNSASTTTGTGTSTTTTTSMSTTTGTGTSTTTTNSASTTTGTGSSTTTTTSMSTTTATGTSTTTTASMSTTTATGTSTTTSAVSTTTGTGTSTTTSVGSTTTGTGTSTTTTASISTTTGTGTSTTTTAVSTTTETGTSTTTTTSMSTTTETGTSTTTTTSVSTTTATGTSTTTTTSGPTTTGTGTSTTSTSTTTSSANKNLKRSAADELSILAKETAKVVQEVDDSQGRALLRQGSQSQPRANFVLEFVSVKGKMQKWKVNINRLTFSDIDTIREAADEMRALRTEVAQGSQTLNATVLAELKVIVKEAGYLREDFEKSISVDDRAVKVQLIVQIASNVSRALTDISSSMISLESLASSGGGSGSASNSTRVIAKTQKVMNTIIKSGRAIVTESLVATLTSYSLQLNQVVLQVQNGQLQLTSQEAKTVSNVVRLISKANDTVESMMKEYQAKEDLVEQRVSMDLLLAATFVVKESIAFLKSRMMPQATSESAVKYTVNESLIALLTSLQEAPETVTESQIDNIFAFELEVEKLLENERLEVKGLEKLILANRKLENVVKAKTEESFSHTIITEKAEFSSVASYYIVSITDIVSELKELTETASTVIDVDVIKNATTFLSTLSTQQLNDYVVDKLQEYMDSLFSLLESATEEVGYAGIDDLYSKASEQALLLEATVDKYNLKVERTLMLERAEKVRRITIVCQSVVKDLDGKVSGNASAGSNVQRVQVEEAVKSMTTYMTKLSSKTYTEEDVTKAEDALLIFKDLVIDIDVISRVRGLRKLHNVTDSAVKFSKQQEADLKNNMESKETLEVLYSAYYLLFDLHHYFSDVGDAASGPPKSYFMIDEIVSALEIWEEQGVKSLKMDDVYDVEYFFTIIQEEFVLDNGVAGLEDILELITGLEDSTSESIDSIENIDTDAETALMIYDIAYLIEECRDILSDLAALTEGALMESNNSTVNDAVRFVVGLSRKIQSNNISSDDVDQLHDAVYMLEELSAEVEEQTEIQGISNLTQSIQQVQKVLTIVDQEVSKYEDEEDAELDILTSVKQVIGGMKNLLQKMNREPTDEEFVVADFRLDYLYSYLQNMKKQSASIDEDTLEELRNLKEELNDLFTDDTKVFSGYNFNISMIISVMEDVSIILTESAGSVENLATLSEAIELFRGVSFYLKQVIEVLEVISEFSEDDTADDVSAYLSELREMSLNVTNISSERLLLDMLYYLQDFEETLQKPAGTEELLTVAKGLLSAVDDHLQEIQISYNTFAIVWKVTSLVQVTETIIDDLDYLIYQLEPHQLTGYEDMTISTLTYDLQFISSDVDQVTEEYISEIKDLFTTVVTILEDLYPDEGIGNLLDLRSAAVAARESAQKRLWEQDDRQTVQEDILSFEDVLSILKLIVTETREKISEIGNITSTAEREEVIERMILMMKKVTMHSFSEVDVEDLNLVYDELKDIGVTAGIEIPGLFQLEELTERAVDVIERELQFLTSTQDARARIDLFSAAVIALTDIQYEMEFLFSFFSTAENNGKPTALNTIEDLYTYLDAFSVEELSFDVVEELTSIHTEMYDLYLTEGRVNLLRIAEVMELASHTRSMAQKTLSNLRFVSEQRLSVRLLRRTSNLLRQIEETLQSLNTSDRDGSRNEGENEVIVQLEGLLQEISEGHDVTEDHIEQLESLLSSLEDIDAQEELVGLENAITDVIEAQEIVQMKMSFMNQVVQQSVRQTTMRKATVALYNIMDIVDDLKDYIGFPDSEEENSDVIELTEMIKTISVAFLSGEQVKELQRMAGDLEMLMVGPNTNTGITGLRDLRSAAAAKVEELESSIYVFMRIDEVSKSIRLLERTQRAVLRLMELMANVSYAGDDSEPESYIITELIELLEEDVEMMNEEKIVRIEQILAHLKNIGDVALAKEETIMDVLALIKSVARTIEGSVSELESKRERLIQIETLIEAESIIKNVLDFTLQIIAEVGEGTEPNEESSTLSAFLIHFAHFDSNVIHITEESLVFLRENTHELKAILLRGSSVGELSHLANLAQSVLEAVSVEIEVLESDSRRDGHIRILRLSQEAVNNVLDSLQWTAQYVEEGEDCYSQDVDGSGSGEDWSDSGEEWSDSGEDWSDSGKPDGAPGKPFSITAIDTILRILMMIEDGSQEEMNLQYLDLYVSSLDMITETLFCGARIDNLKKAISLAVELQDMLEFDVSVLVFDARYSETIYRHKVVKSLVTGASTLLESLQEMTGTRESTFSHPIIDQLARSLGRIQESSLGFVASLERQIKTLEKVSANVTENTAVDGLGELMRMAKSAEATLSSLISTEYEIEGISREVYILEMIEMELIEMEKIIKRMMDKGRQISASANRTVSEFVEITEFMNNHNLNSMDDLFMLKEFKDLLISLDSVTIDETLEYIHIMLSAVVEQTSLVSKVTRKRMDQERKLKQMLYTETAGLVLKRAYQKITAAASNVTMSQETVEVFEVSEFFSMLRDTDVLSVDPAELASLETSAQESIRAISWSMGSIAHLSQVVEQLAVLSYRAEKHVRMQRGLRDDMVVLSSLGNSKEALMSTLSTLNSLQETIGNATIYTTESVVFHLYDFLLSYLYDPRLIPDDFGYQLGSFNLSSVTTTNGIGIRYLSEALSITEHYIMILEETGFSIKSTERVLAAAAFQSMTSRLTMILEESLHESDPEKNDESDGESGESENALEKREYNGEMQKDEELVHFDKIVSLLEEWTISIHDFDSREAATINDLIHHFVEADPHEALKHIHRSCLEKFLSTLRSVSIKAHMMAESLMMEYEIHKIHVATYTMSHIIMSLEKSSSTVAETGLGSADTARIVKELQEMLVMFSDIYLTSPEHLWVLMTYTYELSSATTLDGDVAIDMTKLSSTINSTKDMVHEALTSQSIFVETSGVHPPFMFYTEKDLAHLEETFRVSRQSYLLQELDMVLSLTVNVLTMHLPEGYDGSSDSSYDGEDEDKLLEEDLGELALLDIHQILILVDSHLDHLQFSLITDLAAGLQRLKMLHNDTEVEVTSTHVNHTMLYLSHVIHRVREHSEALSRYAEHSTRVVTLQAAAVVLSDSKKFFGEVGNLTDEEHAVDARALENIEQMADILIHWSFMSSSIDRDSVNRFRMILTDLDTLEVRPEPYGLHSPILSHFLMKSQVTILDLIDQSLTKAAMAGALSHGDLYISHRALEVFENLTHIVEHLSSNFPDNEGDDSPFGEQVVEILERTSDVVIHIASGKLELKQIITLEQHLGQLSDLAILLEGNISPSELMHLNSSLMSATYSVERRLMRATMNINENEEDERIDSLYHYFSQLHYFIEGMRMMKHNLTNITVMPEVGDLLDALDDYASHPLDIDFNDLVMLHSSISSFMLAFENFDEDTVIADYDDLRLVVEDIAEHLLSARQAMLYRRVERAASHVLGVITPPQERETADNLTLVPGIDMLRKTIMHLRDNLYTVAREDVRHLYSVADVLENSIEKYGHDVGYIPSTEENLAYIISAAVTYGHLSKQRYMYDRTARILHESEDEVRALMLTLSNLMMEIDPINETTYYEQDDSITQAFNSLVNLTIDLVSLPRDLGSRLESFNLSSVNTTQGTGIQGLMEILDLVKSVMDTEEDVVMTTQFMEAAHAALRTRDAVAGITQALTHLISTSDKSKDDDKNITLTTTSGESTDVTDISDFSTTPGKSTDVTDMSDFSTTSGESTKPPVTHLPDKEPMMDMDLMDIVSGIISIINKLRHMPVLEDRDIRKLLFYTRVIYEVHDGANQDMGEELLPVVDHLSEIAAHLGLAAHALLSAVHVSEAYVTLRDVHHMSSMLHWAVHLIETNKGDSETQSLVQDLDRCYGQFARGFAHIARSEVQHCRIKAYELSVSSGDRGDTEIQGLQELLDRVATVESNLQEARGFLSAHLYHYHKILSMMGHDSPLEMMSEEWKLSSSSLHTFIYQELDGVLSELIDGLTSLGETDQSSSAMNVTRPLLHDIHITLLAARADPNVIQLSLLYEMTGFVHEIGSLMRDNVTVESSSVVPLITMINDYRSLLFQAGRNSEAYGTATSKILLIRNADGLLETLLGETTSHQDMTTIPQHGGTSTTDMTSQLPGNATTTSGAYSSTSTTEQDDLLREDSRHDQWNEARDILMYWTFDSEAVDGASVMMLKDLLEGMTSKMQEDEGPLPEMNELHEANLTIARSLQLYMELSHEWALLQENRHTYHLAAFVLKTFLEVSGAHLNNTISTDQSGRPEDTTTPVSRSTPLGSNTTPEGNSSDNVHHGNQGKRCEAQDIDKGLQRLHQIFKASFTILERWDGLMVPQRSEIEQMLSYIKEVRELSMNRVVLLQGEHVDRLRYMVWESKREIDIVLANLSSLAVEKNRIASHRLSINFFVQVEGLIKHSTNLLHAEYITSIGTRSTAEATSDSTVSPMSTSNSTTTSVLSSDSTGLSMITGNSTMPTTTPWTNGTHACEPQDLLCFSEQLLLALQMTLEDMFGGMGDHENSTTATTTSSPLSTATTESNFTPDHHFMFEYVRLHVYAWSRALRKVHQADVQTFDEVDINLGEAQTIAGSLIMKLRTELNTTKTET